MLTRLLAIRELNILYQRSEFSASYSERDQIIFTQGNLCSFVKGNYQLHFQIIRMLAITTFIACLLILVERSEGYLDISLTVNRSKTYISYSVPFKINGIDYGLSTSLQDTKQFIVPPSQKTNTKKSKKHKASASESNKLIGNLMASSLEGYSFEGWKRFFMEALLYVESRYYHDITINFEGIDQKKLSQFDKRDGVISFGPNLANNQIYQLIKNSTEFVKNDIISIYRGINDKNVRMQLGGFQQSYAKGHRNGILFYQFSIDTHDGKYWVPIKSVSCMREKSGRDDIFYIANSQISLALNIESPYLRLPTSFASELERNFETAHITCKITQDQVLACSNMTSVDLSLNFIQFQIDQGAFINISLYDLRQSYDDKTTETTFRIQFTPNENQLQIGQSIFQSHYVSIDMGQKKMYFSPINRFPSETYGVYLIRFFVGFGIFTIVTAIGAMIWQTFNDPFRKNKLMLDQDGVRLVEYHRPQDIKSEDL